MEVAERFYAQVKITILFMIGMELSSLKEEFSSLTTPSLAIIQITVHLYLKSMDIIVTGRTSESWSTKASLLTSTQG